MSGWFELPACQDSSFSIAATCVGVEAAVFFAAVAVLLIGTVVQLHRTCVRIRESLQISTTDKTLKYHVSLLLLLSFQLAYALKIPRLLVPEVRYGTNFVSISFD